MSKTSIKNKILKDYAKLRSKLNRSISLKDLLDSTKYTKDMIKHHWGSLSELDKAARDSSPGSFHDVSVDSIMSKKRLSGLDSAIKKNHKFMVTAAITGCKSHDGFRAAITTWEKIQKGKLLVLVSSDPAHNLDRSSTGTIDKKLVGDTLVLQDTALNSNVFLSTIKLSAKQIDPITGLGRIGQRNGSFIYASPKQRMKPVATSNGKIPHVLMTTGAITESDYSTTSFMSNRTAYIADHDHVLGAVIVEVDGDKFYFRQVQAESNGDFIDLGVKYRSDGSTSKVDADAFILGDWHSGETDPTVKSVWNEVCSIVNPRFIVAHDIFNGASISPHEEDNIAKKTSITQLGINLKDELSKLSLDIDELSSWAKESLVLVKSNHDEWLAKYLQKAKYAKDSINHGIALKLADAMVNSHHDPLKWGVMDYFSMNVKNPNKIKWLKKDEDFIVSGVQLGAHGHQGANGSKGTLASIESAYGNSVTGHSHTPEILRGAWSVGTSTYLRLDYNSGPSSWLNSSCILYPNGSRQLINVINGCWRL
jgi:hypothetical protein